MTREISLLVNDQPIELDYFVQGFIDHTVSGMLATLRGTGEIGKVEISIEGEEVTINLDNADVPINPFVTKIVKNTITGMVSSLKGVGGQIGKVNITIKR